MLHKYLLALVKQKKKDNQIIEDEKVIHNYNIKLSQISVGSSKKK